jgi:hypothetical protein
MLIYKHKILSFIFSAVLPCCYPMSENQNEEQQKSLVSKTKRVNTGRPNIKKSNHSMYTNLQFSSNAYLGSLSLFSLLPYFPESHLVLYGLLSLFIGWLCYPTFDKITWHLLNPQRIVQPNQQKEESIRLYQITGKDVLSRFALLGFITYTLLLSAKGSPVILITTGMLTRLMLESQFRIFTQHYSEMTHFTRKMEGEGFH